jgi:subtilisin family serine protease
VRRSRTKRTGGGRGSVPFRAGVVAVTVAAAIGGPGAAWAAPATAPDRVGAQRITLDGAQVQQVRGQLATHRDAGRPAGLPASGPASFFIELTTPSTAQVYADALPASGRAGAAAAAVAAKPRARAAAEQVIGELPAAVPGAAVLYSATAVLPGVAVRADAADYEKLATLPGVAAVHPIAAKTVGNTGAAAVIAAQQAWRDLGNTGEDVTIGIIDTGIDYTHADFGGSGSAEEFRALQAHEAEPAPAGVFPNAKVVGGHDFVGDSYDADAASPAYQPAAKPDDNPLDCNGHGSHVAGTAAGYGVAADGSTYRGGYDAVPGDLRIGPGMAPGAQLYALKVFGCEGSTAATLQAIEWAMDPDQDGDPSDHLDVVNLSLGSPYGLPDDADALAIDKAMQMGMLAVISAGNAGDSYDISGSPGNAARSIAVAASDDGYGVFDGWRVDAPAGLLDGPRPGLRSEAYSDTDEGGAVKPDVTGDLIAAPAGNEDACAPLPAGYATGRILLVQANGFTCGSVAKGTNAVAAGATGFVIVDDEDALETGITGVADIPGILVAASDGAVLTDAVAAGQTVTVTFGPSLKSAAIITDPTAIDRVASFSSRGVRQRNGVKPDLTAPGVTLFSAAVGSGSGGVTISGTSMASPVTAGVGALVRAAHPDWTTEEVKADLMNTADHDLYTGAGRSGAVYGPNRVGAGRVDAAAAVSNTVLAYAEAGSGVVSASFGPVEVAGDRVQASRAITVANKGDRAAAYRLSYAAAAEQPGVSFTLSDDQVTVPPGQTRTVTVTMTAVRDELLRVPDPTVATDGGRQFLGEASGRVVLAPVDGGGSELRVPVHSNPKPSSTLVAGSPDGRTITLAGHGIANGPAYQPASYTSLVSAFERLGASPAMRRCTTVLRPGCYQSEFERSVDLADVGVASDAAQAGADARLYFAVSAHGLAATPESSVTYDVFVDADADGAWDYDVATTRIADLDLPLVVVADRDFNLLPSNDAPFAAPLNLVDGSVDTNLFDTDVQVLGVPLSVLPMVQGRISFGVRSLGYFTGTVDDLGTYTDPTGRAELKGAMSFDPLHPGLSFTGDGGTPAQLLPAGEGTILAVIQDPEAYAADVATDGVAKGAMLVLPHNDSATGRTQTVPIGVATSQPPPQG